MQLAKERSSVTGANMAGMKDIAFSGTRKTQKTELRDLTHIQDLKSDLAGAKKRGCSQRRERGVTDRRGGVSLRVQESHPSLSAKNPSSPHCLRNPQGPLRSGLDLLPATP